MASAGLWSTNQEAHHHLGWGTSISGVYYVASGWSDDADEDSADRGELLDSIVPARSTLFRMLSPRLFVPFLKRVYFSIFRWCEATTGQKMSNARCFPVSFPPLLYFLRITCWCL